MEKKELEKWREAGRITAKVLDYARNIIEPGMPLLEIIEKLEKFVERKNSKLAFPINLSIDEVAAHSTPSFDDKTIARGLIKVDIGINVDGYISDGAFSLDLTREGKHMKLIEATEKALEEAINIIKPKIPLEEIGKKIQETVSCFGFSPIVNLCGHELKRWKLHSGVTVPNHKNGDKRKIEEG
ncbi:MAG: M24 family metallopeptidase, partial [Candidatus Pacearchaeota archaeon]|nr:M24 family metallopeptidase [Candidatus Pacearchaeota archaeon]